MVARVQSPNVGLTPMLVIAACTMPSIVSVVA